jgi:hypothetical protein
VEGGEEVGWRGGKGRNEWRSLTTHAQRGTAQPSGRRISIPQRCIWHTNAGMRLALRRHAPASADTRRPYLALAERHSLCGFL